MKNITKSCLFIVLISVLTMFIKRSNENCYDDNFIPYGIKAFDVFVYNTKTDKEYFAGSIGTDYTNSQMSLSNAQSLAYDFAEAHHLKNWDYLCCTVTNSSNCVTKVK